MNTVETPIVLSKREQQFWEILAKAGTRFQTRDELSHRLYGDTGSALSIQQLVMHVRQKLGYDAIENRPWLGYRLKQAPCCPSCGVDLAELPRLRAEVERLKEIAASPIRVVRGRQVLWEEDLDR